MINTQATNSRPLLTIGILTYYKDNFVDRLLQAFTAQFIDPAITAAVEIIVSDDAGLGNPAETVARYREKYGNTRFNRNEKNLGFDGNIEKIFELARGKFCWVLSDDDLVRPDSLAFLISVLRTHPTVGFVCTANGSGQVMENDVQLFENGNDLLEKFNLIGGLVSQCIFNLEYIPSDRRKYLGNLWYHFSIAYEIAGSRPSAVIRPLLLADADGQICRWANGGKALFTFISLKKIIGDLPRYGYRSGPVNLKLYGMAKSLPRTVASARLWGLPITWKTALLLIQEFSYAPGPMLASLIVFYIPVPILKLLKKIPHKDA